MSPLLHVPSLPRTQRKPFRPLVVGDYEVRLALPHEVREAQRVRHAVFCEELGEGTPEQRAAGRDEDRFDAQFEHLLLCERSTGAVVGTYRVQTAESAIAGHGFYADEEFVLADLPPRVLTNAVELGRACILRAHRRGVALLALWRGLASYLRALDKRYLFGCCSLTGVDATTARVAASWLRNEGHEHPALATTVRPAAAVEPGPVCANDVVRFRLPQLFGTYLRHGAKVCSGPALDRAFGTTDFLVLLDVNDLTPRQHALFFAEG